MKKIIYLMYSDNEQLNLWMQYLSSSDIDLVVINPLNDLVELLEKVSIDKLPSLILLDMSIQCPNSNLLQASKVGRWVKESQSSIKIILQAVRSESEITSVEQRWAEKQGAFCLLPMLNKKNLNSQVTQIYEYLNLGLPTDIYAKALESAAVIVSDKDLDHEQLLVRIKDFYSTIEQFQQLIQNNKPTIDTYPSSSQIYSNLPSLGRAVEGCIQAISIDIQKQKRRKLGEKFAQINRNRTIIKPESTGISTARSALEDFIVN